MTAGRLEGKVAIVTGAASGIGRVSAMTMAREGARVVVADRNGPGADAVAAEIRAAGGESLATCTDIAIEAEVQAMVAAAVDTWGALHVLHNNAALTDASMHSKDITVVDLDVETWDLSMAVNARGAMLACKYAVPRMIEAGGGSIINTASNQALAGDLSQTAYGAAKGAVVTLTMSVATAFGRQGVRCNCISPGAIRTPSLVSACPPAFLDEIARHNLVPRIGEPEDIANLALFLASDESSFITGITIRCDGGQLAHLPMYGFLTSTGTVTTEAASQAARKG
jgi:NAD(P)-dependent dehydrogenase (short-subunit alcohol dehydrogenase family)